jgi:hypothetical protein
MAGGPLAKYVTCSVCRGEGKLTKATRFYDGIEADAYRCEKGHESWIDWRHGPATTAQWSASPEIGTSSDDPVERAEYEREMEHFERTRNIKPSKLVK